MGSLVLRQHFDNLYLAEPSASAGRLARGRQLTDSPQGPSLPPRRRGIGFLSVAAPLRRAFVGDASRLLDGERRVSRTPSAGRVVSSQGARPAVPSMRAPYLDALARVNAAVRTDQLIADRCLPQGDLRPI